MGNYNLIEHFFSTPQEYIKFLVGLKERTLANKECTCMATLTEKGDYYLYRLEWLADGKFIGDYIKQFSATQ